MDGTADMSKREENMAKWFTQAIKDPAARVLVVRDENSGYIISYAQWELPKDKNEVPSALPETEEEKAKIRENRAARVRSGQNGPLLQEWWSNLDVLQTTFGTEPLYYLNALKTIPSHRGKGLASQLVRRLIDEADEKGMRVGLYTNGDGKAKLLYERLGFVEAGRFEIKLGDFGGEGRHLELSMIRNPTTEGGNEVKNVK
ncbi:hypothetical protein BKA67DRAFT_555858 [Truncatella angustata]|uniref:N-acetyltransferase domain-containing protein n=1 Tax=Truncatella angustata TaxID=152316 RepID=A0A9P8USW5_9PEZI|nr:uncharacterized protein BKA67DRAFT_555858 [Truncatella angustata]KAH6657638.1 hypothetical protein BKA67DRAFT_555858 [Truncatella angustata]